MRRILICSLFTLFVFGIRLNAQSQETLVPAGTLLHCTMNEPNFSSATADVGDPVICHLSGVQEFGRVAFPRGSYLQGHLEAARDPGHFFGKGYMRLEFDRIGLPNTDVPVPSKVVALRGYRVDREGDIMGKGHAKRDAVEWLFPPLWPWKVIALPARGPRPALKGESQLTLRLMDDIVIPKSSMLEPGWHYFGENSSRSGSVVPSRPELPGMDAQPAAQPAATPAQPVNRAPAAAGPQAVETAFQMDAPATRVTLIALKSDEIYAAARYRVDGGAVNYILTNGASGAVSVKDVDWLKTSQLNSERRRTDAVDLAQAR
jgi:hypothetical protein